MKTKIKVTWDMEFDAGKGGECNTNVTFSLPDYPDKSCPEEIKKLVIGEIGMLCAKMIDEPGLFE